MCGVPQLSCQTLALATSIIAMSTIAREIANIKHQLSRVLLLITIRQKNCMALASSASLRIVSSYNFACLSIAINFSKNVNKTNDKYNLNNRQHSKQYHIIQNHNSRLHNSTTYEEKFRANASLIRIQQRSLILIQQRPEFG